MDRIKPGDKIYIIENTGEGPISKIYEVESLFTLQYVGECINCFGLDCEDTCFPLLFIDAFVNKHTGYPFIFVNNEKKFVKKLRYLMKKSSS